MTTITERIAVVESNYKHLSKAIDELKVNVDERFDRSEETQQGILDKIVNLSDLVGQRLSKLEFQDKIRVEELLSQRKDAVQALAKIHEMSEFIDELKFVQKYWRVFAIGGIVLLVIEFGAILVLFDNYRKILQT